MLNKNLLCAGITFAIGLMLASPSPAAVRLEWKFTKGQEFVVERQQTIKQEIDGDALDRTTQIESNWSVNEISEVGNALIETQVQRVQASVQFVNRPAAKYDSNAAEDLSGTSKILSDSYSKLLEQKGKFEFSKLGSVVPNSTAKKNGTKNPEPVGAVPTPIAGLVFEDKELESGDEWNLTSENAIAGIGINSTQKVTYQYEGPQDVEGRMLEKISIQVDSTFAQNEENKAIQIKNHKIDGTVYFDAAKGFLVESTINSLLEFDVQDEQKQVHKITTTTKVKMKPVETPPEVTADPPATAK